MNNLEVKKLSGYQDEHGWIKLDLNEINWTELIGMRQIGLKRSYVNSQLVLGIFHHFHYNPCFSNSCNFNRTYPKSPKSI